MGGPFPRALHAPGGGADQGPVETIEGFVDLGGVPEADGRGVEQAGLPGFFAAASMN